jgi:hypothetical protein
MEGALFDRIVIGEGARTRVLTPDAFRALPLHERVQSILNRQIAFFLGDRPVDLKLALARMRQEQS